MRILLRTPNTPVETDTSRPPIEFHRRLPEYRITRLVEAPGLAAKLGVRRVLVKDETKRFGLPSFKVLGASWATYVLLQEQLGKLDSDGNLSYAALRAWAAPLGPLQLIAATDGNHGRAVARVAQWFGLKARIFVPDFVTAARRKAIESEHADLVVVNGVYDAAVDAALEAAQKPHTLLVSDTARATSDLAPRLVTAGYTTAFAEVDQQLGHERVDSVFIQAGVGGLASACTTWARATHRDRPPHVAVVEPETAASIMTALAAGEPVAISADQVSAMCVLQCGTISCTAFDNLYAGVSCCLAIEDSWATAGVAELESCGVETGPSGAAGAAGLLASQSGLCSAPLRQHLNLTGESCVLLVATESTLAAT